MRNGRSPPGSSLRTVHIRKGETEGEPALTGAIQVRVEADDAQKGVIDESFSTFGGQTVRR